jgi:hypothetical protein
VKPIGGRHEGWLSEHPDFGLVVPRSPADYAALTTMGPAGKGLSALAKAIVLGIGLLLEPDEAQAGPAGMLRRGAGGLRNLLRAVESRAENIFNPPAKSLRPFEADYPAGAQADANGRLLKDIDGRNLTGENVAGRRVLGGPDEALKSEQVSAAAGDLDVAPAYVPRTKLPKNAIGQFKHVRGPGGGTARRILVRQSLDPISKERVTAHEFGHAIDDIAGRIDTAGIREELRYIYNDLNNPDLEMVRRFKPDVDLNESERLRGFGPEDHGYRKRDVDGELVAEAIRAYMADPNYMKTVAPKTAAAIRAAVNPNPQLSKIIQFNALPAAGLVGITAKTPTDPDR